ncbi:hypothetical protein Tco_1377700 [Tanacetum coccineum]
MRSENRTLWGVRVPLFIGFPSGLPLTCGSILWKPSVRLSQPKGLLHMLYVIKSLQSSVSIACDIVACGRLPLSTFLVDVLRHFRINVSQLSVIEAAKVDSFACSARFLWHTAKNVIRDPAPVAADFNAQDYATIVAHPSPFWKFPEEFLCLVGLSRHYTLDEETYHAFEDRDGEGKPLLLATTVGRTVPLLPVAPARDENELDASVDRLFDEGESGVQVEQGDSAGVRGRHDVDIQLVTKVVDVAVDNVALVQPSRQRKRKTIVVYDGEPSHPTKKLRDDHGTPGGPTVGGKSRSAVQHLLVGAVLNVEVRGEVIPALPFVTTSVSATLERGEGDHIDSLAGANLRTIRAPQRFVISSDSSHHSGTNFAKAEVESIVRSSAPVIATVTTVNAIVDDATIAKETPIKPSLFGASSSSAGGTDPTPGGCSDVSGSDFLLGGIRTIVEPDFDLQKHDQLLTEFNIGATRQISLSVEVRMRAEYNIKEKRRLRSIAEAAEAIRLRAEASKFEGTKKSLQDEVGVLNGRNIILEKERKALDVKVTDLVASVKVREQEVANLDVVATSVHELEKSFATLREKVLAYENCTEQLEKFQDEQIKVVNDKFDKLYADFIEMALHLEERFYPHLLTTIAGPAISRAIEKGMQDGLAAGITHGKEGRNLADVAAYNPSAEDSSVETLMNILHMEDSLAARLGLSESQPHVDQLMVPIHHSPDQTVVGATALSLSLDVSHARVQRIKENIANYRSALRDVFVPLAEPFSTAALQGMEGTSGTAPDTTTALSVTSVSASTIPPTSTDDYEVVHTDGQEGVGAGGEAVAGENVDPFPDVGDA